MSVRTAFAALVGPLAGGLYREKARVTAGWLGNDLVPLVLAAPALLLSTAQAPRAPRAIRPTPALPDDFDFEP